MPLTKSKSKAAFTHNLKAEISAGKPMKQSLAIAYATKRAAKSKKYAQGGMVDDEVESIEEPAPMPTTEQFLSDEEDSETPFSKDAPSDEAELEESNFLPAAHMGDEEAPVSEDDKARKGTLLQSIMSKLRMRHMGR